MDEKPMGRNLDFLPRAPAPASIGGIKNYNDGKGDTMITTSARGAVAAVLASTASDRTQVVPTKSTTPSPHTQDQAHLAAEESTPSVFSRSCPNG